MKILILRFSSIGDIVLTTPVIRCLKQQIPDAEIHYATKKSYASILENNPYIDKLHLLEDSLSDLVVTLQQEGFHYIVDLHHNLRTAIIGFRLSVTRFTFPKLNYEKWLLTSVKINKLPKKHIVDRYFEAAEPLGVVNDQKGLDYFIDKEDEVNLIRFGECFNQAFVALVVGAKFATKQLPEVKLKEIAKNINMPVILLGGPEDEAVGDAVLKGLDRQDIYNACGKLSLNESASVLQQAAVVVSHDTGLMHIAAAFKKRILSVWGNTIPDFGMYPYMSHPKSVRFEVANLNCRPCSKIGYKKCPKGHFKCMLEQDTQAIISATNQG